MDPRERDELRRLQERVYGPDAVAGDVDAASRLARLAREPESGDVVSPDVVASDGVSEDPAEPHDHEPSRPGSSRLSLRVRLVWAGSLVAVAVVAAAVTSATVQPRALGAFPAGSEPVAFLTPDPGFPVPGFFIGGSDGETIAFEDYNGLRPIITTGGAYLGAGNEDQTCLTVVVNADLDSATSSSYSGVLFEGCGANAFAASTQFVVTEDLPSTLRDAFPVGTALQFVYDEESGEVLVSRSDP